MGTNSIKRKHTYLKCKTLNMSINYKSKGDLKNVKHFNIPDMPNFEVKELPSGEISVVNFNNGYSHIVIDDNSYAILNGNDTDYSAWIFEEAMQVLKQLPNNPKDYKPYQDFISC